MLREWSDRSEKRDHPATQYVLGALSALLLLALAIGIASAIA